MEDHQVIYNYVQTNKTKPWFEWLDFVSLFKKPGKQGLVGLFRLKQYPETTIVFKMSRYINYLTDHEFIVMKGLNELAEYCPHFSRTYGTFDSQVDANFREAKNPFEIRNKYPINKSILLIEHIDNAPKLYSYIKNKKVPESILFSAIKQIMMAIAISQQKKFTHYDLHSYNILMKPCDINAVFLYVLDEQNQFCVPTHGSYPIIIDFGFSYISNMDDNPMWTTLAHTDVGFMSDRFDWLADPKLFLITVAGELNEHRTSKSTKTLWNIVKNIFKPLKIDWESGWDDVNEQGAADYALDLLSTPKSDFFKEYDYFFIDLVQSLITLPLKPRSYTNINTAYSTFVREYARIEKTISSPFYNLYILKGIVDSARRIAPLYRQIDQRSPRTKDARHTAIKEFQQDVFRVLNEVSKFCNPKKIHYEKMLCSLYVLADCVQGVLYEAMEARMAEKIRESSKMRLQTVEQIFGAIETNIPDTYEFNSDSKIYVMNCITKETEFFTLSADEINTLNQTHPLGRGSVLYDMYKES